MQMCRELCVRGLPVYVSGPALWEKHRLLCVERCEGMWSTVGTEGGCGNTKLSDLSGFGSTKHFQEYLYELCKQESTRLFSP